MHRIAGEEHAAFAVLLGQQQVLPPWIAGQHLVFHRNADDLLELPVHLLVGVGGRMQGPVLRRILHQQEARVLLGHVIVAAASRAVADRNFVEQLVAAIERLAKRQHVRLAAQPDAERLSHRAGAAVAAGQVVAAYGAGLAVGRAHGDGDAVGGLLVRHIFGRPVHGHGRQRLAFGLQQRLERVLRNELVGLQRNAAVIGRADVRFRLGHGRIRQPQQRRPGEIENDVDIHRDVAAQARGADLLRQAHAPVDFHGPRVDAFHFRQERRLVLPLDQRASDAALAEVDGKRQADGACADDQNLRVRQSGTPGPKLIRSGYGISRRY